MNDIERVKLALPLLQAFAEGKTIQHIAYRCSISPDDIFYAPDYYKVVPDKKTIYVSVYKDGGCYAFDSLSSQLVDYKDDPANVVAMKTIEFEYTEGEGLPDAP